MLCYMYSGSIYATSGIWYKIPYNLASLCAWRIETTIGNNIINNIAAIAVWKRWGSNGGSMWTLAEGTDTDYSE
jgi:hypothetical protein